MARDVVFRTDASLQIGNGHVMRCLTLARALAESGFDCHFVCRQHPGNLIEHIRAEGFVVHALPATKAGIDPVSNAETDCSTYAGWLGVDSDMDAAATRDVLATLGVEWLVVDHYALDRGWESQLRPHTRAIMVIDDLANRPHDCDLLLDQNLGRVADDYAGLLPEACTILTGPRYALLRTEFAELRGYSLQRRQSPSLQRLLVSMGGVDQVNATGRALDALRQYQLPEGCTITVVMGPHAPWLQQVQEQSEAMARPCEVRVNVSDMAQLMADSDLAVGAAGSTSWERCALGLPTVLTVLADNQQPIAAALARAGAALVIPDIDNLAGGLPDILAGITDAHLKQITERSSQLCDGRGVARVIGRLRGSGCTARLMRADESDLVLGWRNHPEVRRHMYTQHVISRKEHNAWLQRATVDRGRHLLVVENEHGPIGFAQFSERANGKGVADWGFYLSPNAPAGSGRRLGAAALSYAFNHAGMRRVFGEALAFNSRSRSLHRNLGFQEVGLGETTKGRIHRFRIDASDWLEMQ